MKVRDFILAVVLLFVVLGSAFADRHLDRAEVLQIFKTLTSQPRKTCIPAGTIEASHLSYKSSNGYTTESTVIVKYDGDRFYWEINIDSRIKQTEPQGRPNSKSSLDDFDLNWNTKRLFAWDGERYTMYFRPGNHAIVTDNPSDDVPVVVNGPLTAGIVPWGYGIYTYENLTVAESSAIEVDVNSQKQIHLIIKNTNAPEMVFVLDSIKDYAVLSYSANYDGHSSVTKTYQDYKLISGRWIPVTITIEQYDESKKSPELLSYDYWNFTSLCPTSPHPYSFYVGYETDALVEFYSSVIDSPLFYRYYDGVDTKSLLQNKLAIVSAHDAQTQNCAMVSLKYAASKLGKNITDEELAQLASEPNKNTSLYSLRQFARELGFHCLATKTDLQTLMNLKNCQAILHLPRAKHYVVLEHIDDEYVWIVDLDSDKFYYRTKLDLFDLDWSEGTALLFSGQPLDREGTFTEITDEELHKIMGGFPKYSCTDLIQQADVMLCPGMVGRVCGGAYRQYYNRYGCEEDEGGGSCTGYDFVGNIYSHCIEDPYEPGSCNITGNWYSQYIRACK